MKSINSFEQEGDVITLPAPYAVDGGDGMAVGALFGIAANKAASGASVECCTTGVFRIAADTALTGTPGAPAYWDSVNRRCANSGIPIGNLVATKLAGATVATVRVVGPAPGTVDGAGNRVGGGSGKSILVIGGDHPYAQWWGTNGSDGMAQMYLDQGIKPYIAINADENDLVGDQTSGYGGTLGKPGMMTAAQAQELQSRGVEFVSHAARHLHFWELLNTGIRIWYTGGEATPTVNITTSALTITTATAGATALTLASYATLTALRTAIIAVAGWNCELATELTGQEPPSSLLPLRAARSVVTIGAGDTTNSNQRFAIAAGLMMRYTGSAYRDVAIACNNGANFLGIYCDGARVASITTASTLLTLSNAVNALNITGLTCLVMDNGYNAQTIGGSTSLNPGQKIRETYCFGDEDALSLGRIDTTRSVAGNGLMLEAGLGFNYALRRQVLVAKERALSTYGVSVKTFAQPGGRLPYYLLNSILDEHGIWRGNLSTPSDKSQIGGPSALPLDKTTEFMGHFTSLGPNAATPYSEGDVKAVIDAMGETPGFIVNWLNHLLTPTPSDPSPYTGLDLYAPSYYLSSADQNEGPFYRELQHAAAARGAGLIEIMTPEQARLRRIGSKGPDNFVFNPKFRNGRGDVLLNESGPAMPGFSLDMTSTNYSAATVDADRALCLTTNGAIAIGKTPIEFFVRLEPGKTYTIGGTLDLTNWGSNKVNWTIYPVNNSLGDLVPLGVQSVVSNSWRGPGIVDASFRLRVPAVLKNLPAQIITKAGPFTFGGSDSITLQIDTLTTSAAISLAGLTTARQVANAINTAIAADATYGPLGQYNNVATVENNRVVISSPVYVGPEDLSFMSMGNVVGTPMAVLFGAGISVARATAKLHAPVTSAEYGYKVALSLGSTGASQSLRLLSPYCRVVRA